MKIIDIHWQTYNLPFAQSFTTAHGAMATREGAILTITTDTGMFGIGEMAPFPAFGGETLVEACEALAEVIPRLRESPLDTALHAIQRMPRSVACGLEMALLDIQSKRDGYAIGMLLSDAPLRNAIPVNAVIGAQAVEDVFVSALTAKQHGFSCVKLKVGGTRKPTIEIERVAAARSAIGPDTHLRLDANEAWTLEEANAILSLCVPYRIQYVEQPLTRDNLAGMQQLRRTLSIPIAADEAIHDLESARRVMRYGAADILIIKPQLAGGLYTSRQIISEATQRGVQCVITTTIESGISLAAALHLVAASPEVTLACGLATQHLLIDDLIREEILIHNGTMTVPTGPGLGVTLDNEALETYSPNFFHFHPLDSDEA
ncbi:MAG: enolase C-terminal domain-like protein [Ktedonobacteraceae bacterium]